MLRQARPGVLALLLAATLAGNHARAEGKGQADLDRATEASLTVVSKNDLNEVIRLCDSALEKGLDEANTLFAKTLLASKLIARAQMTTVDIAGRLQPGGNWQQAKKEALADLERAITLDAAQPEAHYMIARLNLLPGGDLKRVSKAVDEVIRLSTDEPRLQASALTIRARLQKDPKKQLADLNEAIHLVPGDVDALRKRGLLHAGLGKLELALADFQAAIKINPKHAPTYEAQAMVLRDLKRYDQAIVSLDRAREIQPQSISRLALRVEIQALQSNFEAALHDLNRALAERPNAVAILLLRANIHRAMDQPERALTDLAKVLKLNPDFVPAMRLRAILLAQNDRFNEAIAELVERAKSPKLDQPARTNLRLLLADLYSLQKKPREAIRVYSDILAKEPDSGLVLRARADALLGIGKHAEAIVDYEKALKLQPKDAGVLNNLAWVLATSPEAKLRDGKRAVDLATKACELTKYKAAHILSTLAAAHAESGDFKTAVKWSEKAFELAGNDQKEELHKELKSFQAKKAWRELLSAPDAQKPDKKKPKAKKPDTKKPDTQKPDAKKETAGQKQ